MSDGKISIAIIFTCYNRAEKTRQCIHTLQGQKTTYDIDMDYYVCNDGSEDDTDDVLKSFVPEDHIVYGDGSLFWTRGMYKAMSEARRKEHDFYLMINDDVVFYSNALQIMLDSYFAALGEMSSRGCGIVGSTYSKIYRGVSYGGWRFIRKIKIGASRIISPSGDIQKCELANWNCFLLPQAVIDDVGLIDPFYLHAKGDFDYSLMMRRKGFDIYVATDYIGKAENDNKREKLTKQNLNRKERWKRLNSVKGVQLRMEFHYFVKNWRALGFLFFFYSYTKTVWCEVIKKQ